MIRITRQTDYGIVLLTQMATRPLHEVHAAKDAARWSGLPLPMVSKILKTLARGGLLISHRGVKGGYSLARGADQITVGNVILALEGPIRITECSHGPGSCDQEIACPTRVNWQRINNVVRDALEGITLTEMINPASAPAPLVQVGASADLSGSRAL
jgi:FeS assembly SUF system regulator